MAKRANERITENLFEKYLKDQGITKENGWNLEFQSSLNPKLTFTSKTGRGGAGKPDFIISKIGEKEFVIIVEAKSSPSKLIKDLKNGDISEAKSNTNPYAVNGAYHYAKDVNEDFDVIFIGCAGESEDDFVQRTFLMPKGSKKYVEIKKHSLHDLNMDFENTLISMKQEIKPDKSSKSEKKAEKVEKTAIQISDDDAKNLAADIHELLRDFGGVPANQKPVLIAAVLLACDNPGFSMDNNVLSYKYKDLRRDITISSNDTARNIKDGYTKGYIISRAAIDRANDTQMVPEKLAKIESSFKFIETHSALNRDSKINGEIQSVLNILCEIILGESTYLLPSNKRTSLYDLIKQNTINDILGHFYSEFLSYGGSDGKDLGIVLTPSHITSLMVDLVDFGINDRLYDCCTGTGGFLVAGMSKTFEEVLNNPKITNKDEIIRNLRAHAFIGCEIEDFMFTIAATNMILRGDGRSNLFVDSCFNIEETVKLREPTCAVLNPPYSLKSKGMKELDFIMHACEVTKEGGLVAAIVPKSVFLDRNKKLRSKIMQKHTLDAVITPPDDLFSETAGTQVAIGIFKAHVPHDPQIKTWLCNFDDGFKFIPRQGRIDQGNFDELSKELVTRYKNREVIEEYSKLVSIKPEMECLYDCHMDTAKPKIIEFKYKLKNYICQEIARSINKYIKFNQKNNFSFNDYKTPKIIPDLQISFDKWKEFIVEDLFTVEKGQRLTKNDVIKGEIPYASATSYDNGIAHYIDNELKTWKNALTCVTYGEPGISFFHDYIFSASDSVCVLTLKDKELTKFEGIFISTCLEKLKPKYSYGKGLNLTRLRKETIWLPVKDGKPDWEFMEAYIKSLNFSEILK